VPTEIPLRPADVRPALLGIVLGEWVVLDRDVGADKASDGFGELQHGELGGIAQIVRLVAFRTFVLHQSQEPIHEFSHVAEGSSLAAVAVDA